MNLALLTIGQTPRVDIVSEIRDLLGPATGILEAGALDGLSPEDVEKLAAEPEEDALVTRLRDGREVKVGARHIRERIAASISLLQHEDVDLIALMCTGDFPAVASRMPVLHPDRILVHAVRSILEGGRLGVLVPCPEQIPSLRERWLSCAGEVVIDWLSPYTGSAAALREKAESLAAARVDLVVLDCFGYGRETKKVIRQVTNKPVLLPRTLVARIAGELLEGAQGRT